MVFAGIFVPLPLNLNNTNMNHKQQMLDEVIDIVVDCCDVRYNDKHSVTRDDVLGASKREPHVLTRSMLALQLKNEGYTIDTIAMILSRSPDAVRDMIQSAYQCIANNKAYRRAAAQVALRCCDLPSGE